jgi:hypothetical protein
LANRHSLSLKCVAKIAGFDVLCRGEQGGSVSAFLHSEATYTINYNPDNPIGTMMSLEHSLRGVDTVQARLETDITRDEKALAEYKLQSEKSFEHEERLKDLLAEQGRLNAALDLDKADSQAAVIDSDDIDIATVDKAIAYLDEDSIISTADPSSGEEESGIRQKDKNEAIPLQDIPEQRDKDPPDKMCALVGAIASQEKSPPLVSNGGFLVRQKQSGSRPLNKPPNP